MNNRYKGDQLGEIDNDGIAQWYPKCKVRKEGDVYIATPHTTNPSRRTVRKQKEISVFVKDGKYALENPSDKPLNDNVTQTEQSTEQTDKSPSKPKETSKTDMRITTFKQIFDELYDKYSNQLPHIRKQSILKDMLPLFPTETDAAYFVDEHWRRKWRNAYTRKQRFEYKAYNQNYEYFFTVTFDSKMGIITETTKESLEECEATKREITAKLFDEQAKVKPKPSRDEIRKYIRAALAKPSKQMIDLLVHKVSTFRSPRSIITTGISPSS